MDDRNIFLIATTIRFGHVSVANPDYDRVAGKLPALNFYSSQFLRRCFRLALTSMWPVRLAVKKIDQWQG